MSLFPHAPRAARFLVLGGVILLHLAVMAWLFASRTELPPPTKRSSIAISFELAAEAPEPEPVAEPASVPAPLPAPPDALEPPPLIVPAVRDAPVAQTITALTIAPASECAPLDRVDAEISSDAAARAAIVDTPPAERSIANAIVIWNNGWQKVAASIEAPLAPVRSAVERALAPLAPSCLDLPIAGPRLIQVPTKRGTAILVFGSGVWTWNQLFAH